MLGGQAPPLREHLDRIATERDDIYRCRPPEGLRVPIMVTPAAVDNIFPKEAHIKQAVRNLKGGRASDPSGMQAENIKGWLREASREKKLVRRRWRLLVRLIQRTLKDGDGARGSEMGDNCFLHKREGGGIRR